MTAPLPAAVLWDMDGTLVDTEPHWRDAQRELFEAHGLPPLTPVEEQLLVGADLADAAAGFAERIGRPVDPDELMRTVGARVLELTRTSLVWRPGARELLDALAATGVPCALVTNSLRPLVDVLIEAHGGEPFAAIVTAEDVERAKPAADPYLVAAARLGVDPRECVVLEDSNPGVRAGVAAGCAVIGIPHGSPLEVQEGVEERATLEGVTPADLGARLARARRGA